MPPAARGALFVKTAPLDPPQKLFIHGQPALRCFNHCTQLIKSFAGSRGGFSKEPLAAGGIGAQDGQA